MYLVIGLCNRAGLYLQDCVHSSIAEGLQQHRSPFPASLSLKHSSFVRDIVIEKEGVQDYTMMNVEGVMHL